MYTFLYSCCCWYGMLIFFFQHSDVAVLQEKHRTWATEDTPVNDTIMKNFPSSLSVTICERLICDFAACRKIQDRSPIARCRSGRDGRIALRLPSDPELSRQEEKRTEHLPHSRFLSDSLQECSYCQILYSFIMFESNLFFLASDSMLFHITLLFLPQICCCLPPLRL